MRALPLALGISPVCRSFHVSSIVRTQGARFHRFTTIRPHAYILLRQTSNVQVLVIDLHCVQDEVITARWLRVLEGMVRVHIPNRLSARRKFWNTYVMQQWICVFWAICTSAVKWSCHGSMVVKGDQQIHSTRHSKKNCLRSSIYRNILKKRVTKTNKALGLWLMALEGMFLMAHVLSSFELRLDLLDEEPLASGV